MFEFGGLHPVQATMNNNTNANDDLYGMALIKGEQAIERYLHQL